MRSGAGGTWSSARRAAAPAATIARTAATASSAAASAAAEPPMGCGPARERRQSSTVIKRAARNEKEAMPSPWPASRGQWAPRGRRQDAAGSSGGAYARTGPPKARRTVARQWRNICTRLKRQRCSSSTPASASRSACTSHQPPTERARERAVRTRAGFTVGTPPRLLRRGGRPSRAVERFEHLQASALRRARSRNRSDLHHQPVRGEVHITQVELDLLRGGRRHA